METTSMSLNAVDSCLPIEGQIVLTWNRKIFGELQSVLGDDRADSILSKFWLDLCRRFENTDDGESLRRDAHVVKSTAGLLGFESLEVAARTLETACIENRPLAALTEALAGRRQEVGEALLSR